MYLVVVGVLALVLKLLEFGPFATLSWWLVLAPFALAVVWWSWSDASGFTKREEVRKEAARVAARRKRRLDDMGLGVKAK